MYLLYLLLVLGITLRIPETAKGYETNSSLKLSWSMLQPIVIQMLARSLEVTKGSDSG